MNAGIQGGAGPDASPQHRGQLLRVLGVGFGIAIVVGGAIGSGILASPGLIAGRLNDPILIITVWLMGGLYALLGANVQAELSTALPRAGGLYVYARRAYGDYAGFALGWGDWLQYTISQAAILALFAEYAAALVPAFGGHVGAIAVATVLGFAVLHSTGVRAGSAAQQVTSALKVLALIGFVVACFWFGDQAAARAAPTSAAPPSSWPVLLLAMLVSMQMVMQTYSGWNSAIYFAEEDVNPGRNLPRALFGGVLVVIGVYVLVNLAYLHVLPLDAFGTSRLPAADAMQAVFGGRGGQIVTLLAALSLLGILNGGLMNAPRILFSLGRDGWFSARVQTVNAGGTPVVALLITATLMLALTLGGTFEKLFLLAAFFGVLFDATIATSLFVLRRREPALPRPFKAFAYPFAPLLYALIAVALFAGFLINDLTGSLIPMAVVAASYPIYRLVRKRQRAASL
ncbi:MAG: amino acid permease [Proteobacteria bacterium]|nr:amino acid permease [Pseudomonadota bacterium]